MKYATLVAMLAGCGGMYVHQDQPKLWNHAMDTWGFQNLAVSIPATAPLAESPVAPVAVPQPMVAIQPSIPTTPKGAVASGMESDAVAETSPTPMRTFDPPTDLTQWTHSNWTTSDGRKFQDIRVIKVEPDCVTIMHHDGGGTIDISTLPEEIQRQLHYDPELAAEAAQKRGAEDQESASALAQERTEAQELHQRKLILEDGGVSLTEDQYAGFKTGLDEAKGHVQINSSGVVTGDPYWVDRYWDYRRLIERHDRDIEERRVAMERHDADHPEIRHDEFGQRTEEFRRDPITDPRHGTDSKPQVVNRPPPPPVTSAPPRKPPTQ